MKIKQKIHVGFGLLFLVVLFFGGLSLFYVRVISNSNNVILKDNYATLKYVNEMRSVLETNPTPLPGRARATFTAVLDKERANVTEPGEREAVKAITNNLNALSTAIPAEKSALLRTEVLNSLMTISRLNLDAVERKSAEAQGRIKNATIFLGGAALLTFVVLFSFVFNLAGFFDAPLHQVSEAMQQIAKNRMFESRLDLDRNDEFGELSASFNKMSESLSRLNREWTAKLATERRCSEILLEHIKDPVVRINESQEIVYANPAAGILFDSAFPEGRHNGRYGPKVTASLTGYKPGSIRIGDADFNLQVHELIGAPSTFPEIEGEEDLEARARGWGRIYIFNER